MTDPTDWPGQIFAALKAADVTQVAYVPDAGHGALIRMCHADPALAVVPLTTEEEGIALATGAWLGGARACLLMQSSGVGNCINMLSLPANCRGPLLMLVTMRGEMGETNPWQIPMGQAVPDVLRAMGVVVHALDRAEAAAQTVAYAAQMAFDSNAMVAVLIRQSLIGAKRFVAARAPALTARQPKSIARDG
jgi:sulfopyruvate decarboxylase alpha subunit